MRSNNERLAETLGLFKMTAWPSAINGHTIGRNLEHSSVQYQ